MADFWSDLVNTALLGTDKQAFDESLLPESIRAVVQKADKKDKEALFYKTAALASQYYKAGTQPQQMDLLAVQPCVDEDQPYAPVAAIALLRKILEYEKGNLVLLERWLEGCVKKGWVIAPELLRDLLNKGTDKKYKDLQSLIVPVAGKRGQWLVQFNPEWRYLQEPDYALLWEEGKTEERKFALEKIRKNNPAQAREMLEASWKQESAKNKLEFLTVLSSHLTPDDEPFLQQVFDEIQTIRQKKKDATPDLLRQVVALLVALPNSKLSLEIWENTKRYVQKKSSKKLLGLVSSESYVLSLSAQEDDYLNKDNMWHRLGILEESYNKSLYTDIEGWLYELIARIPPHRWNEYLETSTEDVLTHFNTDAGFVKEESKKEKKTIALFTIALAEAAILHKDKTWQADWLRYFSERYPVQTTQIMTQLVQMLDKKEQEAFYQKYIDLSNSASYAADFRNALTTHSLHAWSLEFTQYVVKNLAKDMKSYNYGYLTAFLNQVLFRMHPDIRKEDLSAYLPSDIQSWVRTQYDQNFVYPLQELMALRLEMEQVFA